MKKIFTLGLSVCLAVGAANAQSKAETTRSKVVNNKADLKVATSQKLSKEQVQTIEARAAKARRADQLKTQEQFDAHMEEKRKHVEYSGRARKGDDQ